MCVSSLQVKQLMKVVCCLAATCKSSIMELSLIPHRLLNHATLFINSRTLPLHSVLYLFLAKKSIAVNRHNKTLCDDHNLQHFTFHIAQTANATVVTSQNIGLVNKHKLFYYSAKKSYYRSYSVDLALPITYSGGSKRERVGRLPGDRKPSSVRKLGLFGDFFKETNM